jgi:D-alanyl-D-alanine carboxypeptidase/D-alanyl-D-alanine-endopeptidase (penicillin-binding protein 4)
MASRLKDLPAGAIVRAKTGSLDHVNAVSGYLTTSRGERFAFSIMCNNHTLQSHPVGDIIDEILLAAEKVRN